ncbi:phosphatidylinositol mannoside acyltransferase [Gordonia sp. (in: high G+C Gram-positive bacteria)]|uniref:phosphatidylinositol mannoside acyltransferase n=1 Tax=Gordonia sp. (in: high G+C Gram-positive bacteria) TaxID=84139 RepID=UPI0039E52FA2
MVDLRAAVTERLAEAGYAAGWSALRHTPDPVARGLFARIGEFTGRRGGGPAQLRRNLARVVGTTPDDVPDQLLVDAMSSYLRYWCEAFRLPSADPVDVAAHVHIPDGDRQHLADAHARGKGVVLALPHTGNWDAAGVWLVQNYGTFSTVAERLKPESLYRRFVDYRESLGFEIFPLSGGEQPPFAELAQRLRDGGIVCLLGDRDLARHGVPVTLFGEPTRMPAGPAKLAVDTGAALLPAHHWFDAAPDSTLFIGEPIDVAGGIPAATQALADVFERNIAAHPADWHMLQPLWEADWSEERRHRVEGAE